jgi:hypothetical protein
VQAKVLSVTGGETPKRAAALEALKEIRATPLQIVARARLDVGSAIDVLARVPSPAAADGRMRA